MQRSKGTREECQGVRAARSSVPVLILMVSPSVASWQRLALPRVSLSTPYSVPIDVQSAVHNSCSQGLQVEVGSSRLGGVPYVSRIGS